MTSRPRPWKLASLVSSALLIGAFVAYRAGAFTSDAGPVAQSTKPPADPATEPGVVEYFGGSKYRIPFEFSDEKPVTAPLPPAMTPAGMEADGEEEHFPGSKSLIGLPRKPKPPTPPPVLPLPPPIPSDPPQTAPSKPVPPSGQRAPAPGE